LKVLVAVELQLRSDSLFLLLHCQPNRVQDKINRLLRGCLVGHDTVVIQIPDHRQIQYTFLGLYIGNICNPFAVGTACVKLPFQQILISMYLLTEIDPLPAATDFSQ